MLGAPIPKIFESPGPKGGAEPAEEYWCSSRSDWSHLPGCLAQLESGRESVFSAPDDEHVVRSFGFSKHLRGIWAHRTRTIKRRFSIHQLTQHFCRYGMHTLP